MARARNIKPGFFTNGDLLECSPLARLLFIGLWCEADRRGVLEDRPKNLKVRLLPGDNCDVEELLDELEARGFVVRYESSGVRCLYIPNFNKHQNPHQREQASTLPAPDCMTMDDQSGPDKPEADDPNVEQEPDAGPVLASGEPGTSPADSPIRIPDSGIQANTSLEVGRVNAPSTPADDQRGGGNDDTMATKRKQRLPGDFVPSAALRAWARETLALDEKTIEYETEKFCDHFRASGATKLDWPATWKNWMRGAAEGRYVRPVKTGPAVPPAPPPPRGQMAKTKSDIEAANARFLGVTAETRGES